MRELTKDFEINGTVYRVEKLSARDGAWLWFFFSSRAKSDSIQDTFAGFSEGEFNAIADKILAKTSAISAETSLPVPVRHVSGQIVEAALSTDATVFYDLIMKAVGFNLSPFFEKLSKQKEEPATPSQ